MSDFLQRELLKARGMAVMAAIIGAIACVLGVIFQRHEFFISYLYAYLFWFGLTMGCFQVTMIHHLTSGRWGGITRRFLEAGMSALPVMAVLFIPIFFGVKTLYPWARPEDLAHEVVLQKRAHYENLTWFIVRSAVFLGLWTWMAVRLRQWSLQQDHTPDLEPTRKMRRLSGIGIVIYPFTGTLVYVDWLLSIEPDWYSTMFPVIVCISQILIAVAFAILALIWAQRGEPWRELTDKMRLRQLGNLLLAFVMFWTYISFGQLLVIYSGNLPAEIHWYLHRIAGDWKLIVAILAAFHFFVPFYALLFRGVTRHLRRLAVIAALVFLTGVVDAFWCVVPTFYPTGIHIDWMDVAALVALGGVWFALFATNLARAPVLPRNDPRLEIKEEAAHAT
jgi:hypothetical protein